MSLLVVGGGLGGGVDGQESASGSFGEVAMGSGVGAMGATTMKMLEA